MDNKNLELSQAEMNLLVGGSCQNLMFASDDLNNANSIVGCMCPPYTGTTNSNNEVGCHCETKN